MLKNIRKQIVNEVRSHPTNYILLAIIIILAFFARVYRLDQLLGFYFDQGRDAMVIWRLWHEARPFLIGPVTGLAGIFLGPLYYYLIAPFYLVGGGNPVTPAVFLAFLATAAILMLYYLGWKMQNRLTGLVAATIGAFSINLIRAGRWLANPTPILLTSMLLLWSMWEIVCSKTKSPSVKLKVNRWWIIIALIIGISLQFEAASAVFYLPMILVFALWQRKNLPDKKTFLTALGVFLVTLLPQIAFNFRHENILFDNFKRVLLEEKSFTLSFWEVLGARLNFFWDVFNSKIIPNKQGFVAFYSVIILYFLIKTKDKLLRNKILPLFIIFLTIPVLGFILFQGNFGNIYDYYLTGYYLPMILIFSLGLGKVWENQYGKIVILVFFLQLFIINAPLTRYYLIAGIDGPENITLGNELQAVNWVFEDAQSRGEFNVDVYVPPVIPHSYDYLFLWQGARRCGEDLCGLLKDQQVSLLYTLYEVDPPHPWRLEAWLKRQEGIGKILEEERFGGITVQRRERL